jgi:DNA/RNA-binding domain of Phe-tRNA-synthetase-like protein
VYATDVQNLAAGKVAQGRDERTFCPRWAWRESDPARSAPETRDALLTIEGVKGIEGASIEAAMEELVALVREHCGGEISLLDRHHPWAVME